MAPHRNLTSSSTGLSRTPARHSRPRIPLLAGLLLYSCAAPQLTGQAASSGPAGLATTGISTDSSGNPLPIAARNIAFGAVITADDLIYPGPVTGPATGPVAESAAEPAAEPADSESRDHSGDAQDSANTANSTHDTANTGDQIGHVALVPILKGATVTTSMTAQSVQQGLVPEGKVLTVVSLANSAILQYAQPGTHLDVFGSEAQESTKFISNAQVLYAPGFAERFAARPTLTSDLSDPDTVSEELGQGATSASGAGETYDTWFQGPDHAISQEDSSTVLLAVTPKEAARLAQVPVWENSLMAAIVQ
jgi:hypothetical protein